MNTINEQQLQKVKDVAFHRLNPEGLRTFLVISLVLSSCFTLIPFFADKTNSLQVPWITVFLTLFFILWALQLVTAIFFFSIERAYRYQKWLVVFVNVWYVKLTFELFGCYFLTVKGGHHYLYLLGFGIIVFTIAYLLLSMQRAKINIEKGEGTSEGKGILSPVHFPLWVWLPIVVYGILLVLLIWFFFGGIGNALFLAVMMPMILGLCYAYPEFFFLAYGKWKFPSFNMDMPIKKKKPASNVTKGR